MKVSWYGHACFLFEGQGVRLVTDPPGGEMGYLLPEAEVDLVTVSHGHSDHNNVNALRGTPAVISTAGVHDVKGLKIQGFPTFHDNAGGSRRGNNLVFTWEMDGVRVCHLGDLGHLLEADTVRDLGRIDLLLVPVGGFFTVDAAEAKQVVDQLKPRIAIPMHYRTTVYASRLNSADDFVCQFRPEQVRRQAAGASGEHPSGGAPVRSATAPAGAGARRARGREADQAPPGSPPGAEAALQVEGASLPSSLEVVVMDYCRG